MGAWSRFLETFFNWRVIERYSPDILKGTVVTIEIAVAVVITGILFGLVLAVVRAFRVPVLNTLIVIFVDIFRALPPLVLILLVYFGLPNIGINLPSFAVLWLVLASVLAAFAEEIFWAGILSIPKGQWEAARSTGLSFLGTLVYIVLPQAIRLTVPPLTNRTIAITKNTALGTVIGVGEILNQATSAQSFSGNATPLMMGAIAYLILFIPGVVLGRSSRPGLSGAGSNGNDRPAVLQPCHHGTSAPARPCRARADDRYLSHRHSAWAGRGPRIRDRLAFAFAQRTLGGGCMDRFLSCHSAARAADLYLFRVAVRRAAAVAHDRRRHGLLPQHVELLRRDLSCRHRKRRPRSMGCRALDRPTGLPDAGLCRAAASGAQRAARSRVQYRRGGKAHVDCERGGAARAALFGRHGAVGNLQFVADRAGRGDLPCYAVADRAPDQPAGAAGGRVRSRRT